MAHTPNNPDQAPTTPAQAPQASHAELPKAYRPADHETRIRGRWMSAKAFHADPARVLSGQAKPFSVLIPPPNVTARLHLGHALNNTLQDILVRAHRMMGYESMWMPGTDHAGIATQAVVERRLWEEEKKRRHDFTREDFVARVQAWKDDYETQITDQLKLMGCSCDFDRQRFTMDPICAEAVREAFFRLFKDGLIYRGKRLVNWDPALQTAVADDECYDEEIDTSFWYLRYPLVHNLPGDARPVTWDELASRGYPSANQHAGDAPAWVTVATTRPETYLADTAVAVNPHDPRAPALRGLSVELPLVGRIIPVIEDSYVVLPEAMARSEEEKNDPKAKYATGFLKVTPGHDKNDYEIGLRHKLPIVNMMSPDGKVSDKHGWTDVGSAHLFVSLTMPEARKKVVAEFKSHNLLEAIKPYKQTVTYSDRSKAQVEPYLSDQWYVRVTDPRLAASANAALVPDQRSSTSPSQREGAGGRVSAQGHAEASVSIPVWTITLKPQKNAERSLAETSDLVCNEIGWGFEGHRETFDPSHPDRIVVNVRTREAEERMKEFAAKTSEAHPTRSGIGMLIQSVRPGGPDANLATEGDGAMRFFPARYAKTFEQWHDNIRDWCISRQLWWGHRIPVWTLRSGAQRDFLKGKGSLHPDVAELKSALRAAVDNDRAWSMPDAEITEAQRGDTTHLLYDLTDSERPYNVGIRDPEGQDQKLVQIVEKFGFVRDPDVLDTWFSSALWPLSTMGWPNPERPETAGLLRAFNPTSTLCTAREIITLWVSRMTMFNRYFRSSSPAPSGGGGGGSATPEGAVGTAPGAAAHKPSPSGLADSATSPAGSGGGVIPFRHVYIHAVVQDGEGQKMSKSLGNGVDPLDIIETHGSDAMRFTLCQMATQTQDVRLPVDILDPFTGESFPAKMAQHGEYRVAAPIQEFKGKKMVSSFGVASGQAKPTPDMPAAKNTSGKFDFGRNFANKMWNASRFTMSILDKAGDKGTEGQRDKGEAVLPLVDRWMLTRLAKATREIEHALANYEFANYANALYRFIWDDFCDWYLEAIKPTVADSPQQRAVLATALRGALALAHPVMPFITEAIWEQLAPRLAALPPVHEVGFASPRKDNLLCTSGWPHPANDAEHPDAEREFDRLKALITAVREVRAVQNVQPRRKITLHIPGSQVKDLTAHEILIGTLAGIDRFDTGNLSGPGVRFAFEGHEYAVSNLADAVDAGAERARLTKLISDKEKSIATMSSRLANPGYAAKAPPAMVKQTQDQLAKDQAELDAARAALAALPPTPPQ